MPPKPTCRFMVEKTWPRGLRFAGCLWMWAQGRNEHCRGLHLWGMSEAAYSESRLGSLSRIDFELKEGEGVSDNTK